MVSNINWAVPRLGLVENLPVETSTLRYTNVTAPNLWGFEAFSTPPALWAGDIPNQPKFSGRVTTDNYSYGFSDAGRLVFIVKGNIWDTWPVARRNDWLSRQSSTIGTNDAYHLATNWLWKMGVNVSALERSNRCVVSQQFRWRNEEANLKDMLPLFDLEWGPKPGTDVWIEIDGRTKELVFLRLEESSWATVPAVELRNWRKLIRISDADYLRYSDQQRRNLIAEYASSELRLGAGTNNSSVDTVPPSKEHH